MSCKCPYLVELYRVLADIPVFLSYHHLNHYALYSVV